jgi:sulfofructose kinase
VAGEIIAVGLSCYDHLVMVPSRERVAEGARAEATLAQCGGVAATAAVAARALGARSELWTRVGDDRHGAFIIEELRERGVDTSQLVVVGGGRTAVSTVLVERGTGERRFLYLPGGSLESGWDPPDYPRVERASCLLVDGRWEGVCLEAARRARAASVPVIADVGHAGEEDMEILRLADYPVISELALGEIRPGRDLDEFAGELLAGAARALVVTRGARGVWAKEPGGPARTLGAFPVEVVDTTGAGDVFHGAFAYGIASGWDVPRAVEFASAAAAITCTALGGQTAAPGVEDVERMLARPERPVWADASAAGPEP